MKTERETQSHEYQTFLDYIPSGVLQCLNDAFYTMLKVNQGFIKLFGYSREEIKELFQDQFISMIHPDDRQSVWEAVSCQPAVGEKITLQYRVRCKNGDYKWVVDNTQMSHDEEGGERIFCVLTDISDFREAREELRLTMERHQIILDHTTDIIFEWNLPDDIMSYSSNWKKKFGYAPFYQGLGKDEAVFSHIHPEDIPSLRDTMMSIKNGAPFEQIEIRIQHAEGIYIWCRIQATIIRDNCGKPVRAVGIIADIDKEKNMIDELRRRAERDALTGLFNREETERQIFRYLEEQPEKICALYMIDTDNFKQVNDSQGHLFGDAVLTELAAGMKKLTRQTDVVGRIGGDEFTIFLKDIPSREVAAQKAEQLLSMFRGLFRDDRQMFQISCSIGVSIYPEDGLDFQTLYRSADQALYQAKSQGKNQYVIFDSHKALPVSHGGYSSLGAAIDSDSHTAGMPENLVNYVFQVLYDTRDINNAIQLILEIIGKRFDVSRAYIFENSEDGKFCDNTYEWCNEGIIPQKDNLQHYSYEGLQGYDELFKEDAVFYCRDIRALKPAQTALFQEQGIRSTLQCAICDEGRFCGFVGFDECTGLRMWTKEEISTLSLVSQLLTTFLLKRRATERDEKMSLQLNVILDTQDAYVYAIEQGSYRLLYLNHKTRELDDSVKTGMTCHQAFFGRETPCEPCPLCDGTGEIYNPQYGVWTKVRVSPMKWGTVDAYLLSCFDITEYKQI